MRLLAGLLLGLCLLTPARAEPLDQVEAIAREVLAASGAPSASIAVVQDGQIAKLAAVGQARLDPPVKATTATRYGIASVSKQFTAAAVLLLVQDGKLSLDDPVGQYLPGLTAGDRITLRQVLSHTSGYLDYWPQDYVFEAMRRPTTPDKVLDGWARVALDFQPGTAWRYSNTGFTIAGLVVEAVSGQPLEAFLKARIFDPLGMTGVTEDDTGPLESPDAQNYARDGLGPLHPATKEAPGWLFAAAQLAMAPRDLAKWNISLMNRSLLAPASYAAMTTPVTLSSGQPTTYGLGLTLKVVDGRTVWSHGGALSGVLTDNRVWPDQKMAVTVVVNADDTAAQSVIADRIAFMLLASSGHTLTARTLLEQAAAGAIDPALLTANGQAAFTPKARAAWRASLAPLGPLRMLRPTGTSQRGGLTYAGFNADYAKRTISVSLRLAPDGKVEQFMIGRRLP